MECYMYQIYDYQYWLLAHHSLLHTVHNKYKLIILTVHV